MKNNARTVLRAENEALKRRAADATALLTDVVAAEHLTEAQQTNLVGLALDELTAVSGGRVEVAEAGATLREAVSASSEPQVLRGRRARPAKLPELSRDRGDVIDDSTTVEPPDDVDVEEATLTTKARKKLPSSAFALSGRRYPIHDLAHARAALSRAAQHASPEEQAKIRRAVKRRYPSIDVSEQDFDDERDRDELDGLDRQGRALDVDEQNDVDQDDEHDEDEDLDEQGLSNLGRRRAPRFGDDEEDEDAEDEDEEDQDDVREQSLADRLARAGRRRNRPNARRESDSLLARVVGSRSLREADGTVDLLAQMNIDPTA